MTTPYIANHDASLDLMLDRHIDVPRALVWRALTEAELVKKWFCPRPWQAVECRIDLRVGGEFHTVMQSPEGQQFPSSSCFLHIAPQECLIWTAALQPGFRPAAPAGPDDKECAGIVFTCVITLKDENGGTRYTAHVLHGTAQQSKMHADMGFHDGWGTCLTQLVEVAKAL